MGELWRLNEELRELMAELTEDEKRSLIEGTDDEYYERRQVSGRI